MLLLSFLYKENHATYRLRRRRSSRFIPFANMAGAPVASRTHRSAQPVKAGRADSEIFLAYSVFRYEKPAARPRS
jgi:hypothetical protein